MIGKRAVSKARHGEVMQQQSSDKMAESPTTTIVDDICEVFDESQVRTTSSVSSEDDDKRLSQRRKLSFNLRIPEDDEQNELDGDKKKARLLFPMPRWRARSKIVRKGRRDNGQQRRMRSI